MSERGYYGAFLCVQRVIGISEKIKTISHLVLLSMVGPTFSTDDRVLPSCHPFRQTCGACGMRYAGKS